MPTTEATKNRIALLATIAGLAASIAGGLIGYIYLGDQHRIDDSFSKFDSRLTTIDNTVRGISDVVTKNRVSCDSVTNNCTQNRNDIEKIREQFRSVERDMSTMHRSADLIKMQMDDLQHHVDKNTTDISELKSRRK